MTRDRRPSASATVRVENIGGIDETTVSLSPGITALIGPNATNRTSFLQALAGALGGTRVTLKGDSREGRVSLALDGERYTRRLERENGSVDVAGEPYLEDPELVDLYAVLLEDNEVRRAVREDEDLRDAIMRPIDTEAIRREIGTLVDERKEIDEELDRLDVLAEELEEVEGRLEEKRARRDRIEAEAPDRAGAGLEDDLDEELRALREARTDLERVEDDLSIERKSLESLAEERDRVEERYESIPPADEERLAVVEERVATLRDRKRSLESTVSELQRVIGFNETRLAAMPGQIFTIFTYILSYSIYTRLVLYHHGRREDSRPIDLGRQASGAGRSRPPSSAGPPSRTGGERFGRPFTGR